jgi:hypothetical protein
MTETGGLPEPAPPSGYEELVGPSQEEFDALAEEGAA